MQGLTQLQETNRRAAEKELAEMRADTIQYLRMAAKQGTLSALLAEALPLYRLAQASAA